ncbi:50S ribosomal protein L6 [Sporolactobacillus terrae]|uniref:Large ribosomal subunit protein uL6 n=1 Tax=Sporolactobacillus terrae TaxID=269673 RepID=A0A410D597_9BACL|nr:50S ribosomal protein L6 [Sporolactobacillus terrae]QAA21287.1 50S ribosomal protein L6 [Sporolactobacillus terrae]QAA24259.1 50S ribosomal protein L6 [Sporolactobacillus terrae]UAK16063.1 50S ribosomal protein L6 [Sporolactobacillus terrae]BBN97429.1 50S ribosomal protein L6 [Sporolactobacillus terrae]
MSRIGLRPTAVPEGVTVTIDGQKVTVKGPKGELSREFHQDMIIKQENNEIRVERPTDSNKHRALHGTTSSLISNMVEGVTKGFTKKLELVGVGYRANKQGKNLVLNVGYSHPVEIVPEEGIELSVEGNNKVSVAGIDKQRVGEVAANIRSVRSPEPYKGKGIRYEGEKVRRKEGKTGK